MGLSLGTAFYMNMKKVELLAPAGGYETMVGAFNAGADAVYLGGSKFGARAYADNFDEAQVLDAISYAHLHHKKIYMTVNTLVKEREFFEMYDFMLPYAEKNLDGVIVQDLGVMKFLRDEFPNVEVHASTQQTVTGVYGAKLLKELGCCRVVPARELSLSEMKAIREKADIEVEAFIHGAMCYCYSGACLFSSMVGTRSGNRGRCAQPCRLPYKTAGSNGKEEYPISLKDMCTIDLIPELIGAGIDSFKIEGRMKKPEYAAGVTSLYRKYIDLYYKEPDKEHRVSKEDMDILKALYLRTGISDGYYHRHNGREMVTVSSPAYNGTSEEVSKMIKEKYLGYEKKIKCDIYCDLTAGSTAKLTMLLKDNSGVVCEITGKEVQTASNRPMDAQNIEKQLRKLGNTPFEADDVVVSIDDNGAGCGIFIPVSELNEYRRSLCDKMLEMLLDSGDAKEKAYDRSADKNTGSAESSDNHLKVQKRKADIHVLISSKEQLGATLGYLAGDSQKKKIERVYVDSKLLLGEEKDSVLKDLKIAADAGAEVIATLPYVTREEKIDGTLDIITLINICRAGNLCGLLVRNLEQLGYLRDNNYLGKVICDYGVYVWNAESYKLLSECTKGDFSVDEISVPYELTIHEAKDVTVAVKSFCDVPVTYNIYGHVPMMISAGCVKKTTDRCSGKTGSVHSEKMHMIDRMGNDMTVTTDCRNCYNVIWNTDPTVLLGKMKTIDDMGIFDHYRIDFTIESGNDTRDVLESFINDKAFEKKNYTTGHYKRGVE